jgi:hypothetical protein
MGPYMELIVPSSFYRVDAGLHALSFSPGFNVYKLYLKYIQLFTETSYLLMNFISVQFLEKRLENVQILQALRRRFDV